MASRKPERGTGAKVASPRARAQVLFGQAGGGRPWQSAERWGWLKVSYDSDQAISLMEGTRARAARVRPGVSEEGLFQSGAQRSRAAVPRRAFGTVTGTALSKEGTCTPEEVLFIRRRRAPAQCWGA